MERIRVSLSGDGKIHIKLKKKKVIQNEIPDIPKHDPLQNAHYEEKVLLSPSLINQMEIRSESIFRPNQSDVEIVYALSGSGKYIPDTLHKFSSNEVVAHATPDRISYMTEKMIEHINKERDNRPGIVINLHTHPNGISELSQQDKETHLQVAKIMRELNPDINVLFGVHAISEEDRRTRKDPFKSHPHKIKWSSITRDHEVAFFTEDSKPYEIEIWKV